jgi:hypothetical protein
MPYSRFTNNYSLYRGCSDSFNSLGGKKDLVKHCPAFAERGISSALTRVHNIAIKNNK